MSYSLAKRFRLCIGSIIQNNKQPFNSYQPMVAVLLGAACSLALAPYHLFIIPFFAFPILLYILINLKQQAITKKQLFKRSFLVGWLFGLGYFIINLAWLAKTIIDNSNTPFLLSPIIYLIFPAILSIYYGLAFASTTMIGRNKISLLFSFALSMGIFETLRGFLFTGFPWNWVGYMAVPSPLFMQITTLVGVEALNFLSVLIFSLPLLLFYKESQRFAAILLITLSSIWLGWGFYRLSNAPTIEEELLQSTFSVRIVQPSIPAQNRWSREKSQEILSLLTKLSTVPSNLPNGKNPDFIIWSETAIPYIIQENSFLTNYIGSILKNEQLLISGALREDANAYPPKIFNSIIAIDNHGEIISYADKVRLVPFGETIPWADTLRKWGINQFVTIPQGFAAAKEHKLLSPKKDLNILPLICYEVIFRADSKLTKQTTSAILTVSNDGWYGNTAGPHQHFHQARVRAVSLKLPLIRAANNGISAITDGYGRIIALLTYNQIGVLDSAVPKMIN